MTPEQIFEAGRLWTLGMGTLDIAARLKIPEAWVYARIVPIRMAAMARRNAQRRDVA